MDAYNNKRSNKTLSKHRFQPHRATTTTVGTSSLLYIVQVSLHGIGVHVLLRRVIFLVLGPTDIVQSCRTLFATTTFRTPSEPSNHACA